MALTAARTKCVDKQAASLSSDDLSHHRPQLLRFAMLQLRNQAQAEDAVQETLVAALTGMERFAGGSSVRTWLIGILKHKIIDQIRKSSREQPLDTDGEHGTADEFDVLFKDDGHFVASPAAWGNPEQALSQRKFFEVLEGCMAGLPKNTARAFMLREVIGEDTEQICRELHISAANCWVMLYRARMLLRACLEQRWFQGATS
jgi:RNA polymerase sigma-70 factor (ECF subfamily)